MLGGFEAQPGVTSGDDDRLAGKLFGRIRGSDEELDVEEMEHEGQRHLSK